MQQTIQPTDILNFWTEAGGDRWFAKDAEFDGRLTIRFAQALAAARTGMLDRWADTPAGGLALVILLDQFSRNIHRGTPLMFAGDRSALHLAKTCISRGFHRAAPPPSSLWFVMPFEHAEDLDAQWRGLALFESLGLNSMVYWAKLHLDVIARFGRFPHRNAVLGRTSTAEERTYLAEGGFSG